MLPSPLKLSSCKDTNQIPDMSGGSLDTVSLLPQACRALICACSHEPFPRCRYQCPKSGNVFHIRGTSTVGQSTGSVIASMIAQAMIASNCQSLGSASGVMAKRMVGLGSSTPRTSISQGPSMAADTAAAR